MFSSIARLPASFMCWGVGKLGCPTWSWIAPGVRMASLPISRMPECAASAGRWASEGNASLAIGFDRVPAKDSVQPGVVVELHGREPQATWTERRDQQSEKRSLHHVCLNAPWTGFVTRAQVD